MTLSISYYTKTYEITQILVYKVIWHHVMGLLSEQFQCINIELNSFKMFNYVSRSIITCFPKKQTWCVSCVYKTHELEHQGESSQNYVLCKSQIIRTVSHKFTSLVQYFAFKVIFFQLVIFIPLRNFVLTLYWLDLRYLRSTPP